MREKMPSPAGSGVIAVVTILLVLILAVFSALTVSTAQADLVLARRGADTVADYYTADGIARELLHKFRSGDEVQLETLVPMSDMQGLYVSAQRQEDGSVQVLAWKTVLLDDFSDFANPGLSVWTNEE